MNILFRDKRNEELFYEILEKMGITPEYDSERAAVAYLISMDNVCREHVSEIYNFDECCIRLSALGKGWLTGSSRRTLLLAFNLYNGYVPEDGCADVQYIFSYNSYLTYYLEAIKIRFFSPLMGLNQDCISK